MKTTSIIFLFSVLLSVNADCVYTDERTGQQFDLSSLESDAGEYTKQGIKDPTKLYRFNFCNSTISDPCGSGHDSIAWVSNPAKDGTDKKDC